MKAYTKKEMFELEIIAYDTDLYYELNSVDDDTLFYIVHECDVDDFDVHFTIDNVCYAADLQL